MEPLSVYFSPELYFDSQRMQKFNNAVKGTQRLAVYAWNFASRQKVLERTQDRQTADVIVRPIRVDSDARGKAAGYASPGFAPRNPGQLSSVLSAEAANEGTIPPNPEQVVREVRIDPNSAFDAHVYAHELGHILSLTHNNAKLTPGVMRYGVPKGGKTTNLPTRQEGRVASRATGQQPTAPPSKSKTERKKVTGSSKPEKRKAADKSTAGTKESGKIRHDTGGKF